MSGWSEFGILGKLNKLGKRANWVNFMNSVLVGQGELGGLGE